MLLVVPYANLDAYDYGLEDEELFGFGAPGLDAYPTKVGLLGGALKTVSISRAPKQAKLDTLVKKLSKWAKNHRIQVGKEGLRGDSDSDNLVAGREFRISSPMEADALGQQAKALAYPKKGVYFYLVPRPGVRDSYYGVFTSDPRVTHVTAAPESAGLGYLGMGLLPLSSAAGLDSVSGEGGFFKKLGQSLKLDHRASKLERCRRLLAEAGEGASSEASGLSEAEHAYCQRASDANLAAAGVGDREAAAEAAGAVIKGLLEIHPDGRIVLHTLSPDAAEDPTVRGLLTSGRVTHLGSRMFPIGTGMLPLSSRVSGFAPVGTGLLPLSSVNGLDDVDGLEAEVEGLEAEVAAEGFWSDESTYGDANVWAETPGWSAGDEYQDGTRESPWSTHANEALDHLRHGGLVNRATYRPGYRGGVRAAGYDGAGCCGVEADVGAFGGARRTAAFGGGSSAYGGVRRSAPGSVSPSYQTLYGGYGTPVYQPPPPTIVAYDVYGNPLVYDPYGNLVPLSSLPIVSGLAGEDVQYPGIGY